MSVIRPRPLDVLFVQNRGAVKALNTCNVIKYYTIFGVFPQRCVATFLPYSGREVLRDDINNGHVGDYIEEEKKV